MKKITVIGIGNVLMGDDGIGIVLLNRLKAKRELADIEFIETGTGGMTFLHHLATAERVLIIDSGNFEGKPGDFRLFTPDEVQSVKFLPGQSLHEFDLIKAIELSQKLGECPERILILAIQPGSIEWSQQLTDAVFSNILTYEEAAMQGLLELRKG